MRTFLKPLKNSQGKNYQNAQEVCLCNAAETPIGAIWKLRSGKFESFAYDKNTGFGYFDDPHAAKRYVEICANQ